MNRLIVLGILGAIGSTMISGGVSEILMFAQNTLNDPVGSIIAIIKFFVTQIKQG